MKEHNPSTNERSCTREDVYRLHGWNKSGLGTAKRDALQRSGLPRHNTNSGLSKICRFPCGSLGCLTSNDFRLAKKSMGRNGLYQNAGQVTLTLI